ncbi:hypothetical protein H8959_002993 [Pygathrix nigripes]
MTWSGVTARTEGAHPAFLNTLGWWGCGKKRVCFFTSPTESAHYSCPLGSQNPQHERNRLWKVSTSAPSGSLQAPKHPAPTPPMCRYLQVKLEEQDLINPTPKTPSDQQRPQHPPPTGDSIFMATPCGGRLTTSHHVIPELSSSSGMTPSPPPPSSSSSSFCLCF